MKFIKHFSKSEQMAARSSLSELTKSLYDLERSQMIFFDLSKGRFNSSAQQVYNSMFSLKCSIRSLRDKLAAYYRSYE